MSKAIKQCRVCGKDYEYCYSCRKGDITFRWQEVACSPECGNTYFDRIIKSRQNPLGSVKTNNSASKMLSGTDIDDEDDIIEEFELNEYDDDE